MDQPQQPGLTNVRQLQIVAAGLVSAPVVYLVVAAVLSQTPGLLPFLPDANLATPLAALVGAGVGVGLIGFWVRANMLAPRAAAQRSGGDTLGYYARGTILALAFAEVPAILGLVRFLLIGGWTLFLCAIAASLAFGVSMLPSQGHYDDMCAGLETMPDQPGAESEQP